MDIQPLYFMSQRRHPWSRDGSLAVVLVLPTGALDWDGGLWAEVADAQRLVLTFSRPRILLNAEKIMWPVLSFCAELHDGQGPSARAGIAGLKLPTAN